MQAPVQRLGSRCHFESKCSIPSLVALTLHQLYTESWEVCWRPALYYSLSAGTCRLPAATGRHYTLLSIVHVIEMATNLKGKTARKSRVTILDLALSLGILFGTKVDSSTQDGSFYSSLKFNGEIFWRTHSNKYAWFSPFSWAIFGKASSSI